MSYSYTDLLALLGIGGAHPGGLALTRAIFEELQISEDTCILEVGCGTGQTTGFIISNYPCSLHAIDAHPTMIQKATKRLNQHKYPVTILEANVEKIPYKAQMFDIVLSESVTVFTNINKTIPEYYRVLRNGGSLILIEMTEIHPFDENEKKELIQFYGIKQLLNEQQWEEQFRSAGFQEIQTIHVSEEHFVNLEEDFSEFDMSEDIEPKLFNKLENHEALTLKYKEKLGFRVFICKKN
ncbi:class I SAM-dependent methyltransferase [Bacillus suaedaesalsae]|uniref:Methyltransferase domain-containing protein n=1 Tax=Bacillus suaedaesalsae TaxID=2810349 RepID=A0ABS2DIB4_9BACI|nr:class I SAM-dependent methyltransferase [Bacillus suaedaesalsae]MBM6618147.1 methyltransferase domain-containing protein [Bacillus suaedaesalsae]